MRALCACCAMSGVTPVTVDHPLCSLSLRRRSGLISSAYAVKWRASECADDRCTIKPSSDQSKRHIPDCVTRPRCMPITLSTRLETESTRRKAIETRYISLACTFSTSIYDERKHAHGALKKAMLSAQMRGAFWARRSASPRGWFRASGWF